MIKKWESKTARLKKMVNISPKKKLEWLRQMNEFTNKFSSPKAKRIRRILKES